MPLSKAQGNKLWLSRWHLWVEKARKTHGDTYEYLNPNRDELGRVEITCKVHGSFWQRPAKHVYGRGCQQCVGRGTDKLQELKEKFPTWDWSNTEVKDSGTIFKLTCAKHGEFKTSHNRLMTKKEGLTPCPACNKVSSGKAQRISADLWGDRIENAYGGAIALLGATEGSQDLALFTCIKHGEFMSRPMDVWHGHGCPACGDVLRVENLREAVGVTPDEFYRRALESRGSEYSYDMSTFQNMKSPMRILCNKHGEFWQRPANHLALSAGCPVCASSVSKGEDDLANWLIDMGQTVVRRDRKLLGGSEIDILLPDHDIGIEYCGVYWHGEGHKSDNYHAEKRRIAASAGVTLLHVFEDEWLEKSDIVKSIISHKLGLGERVGARTLTVCDMSWKQARDFFERCHISGAGAPAKACYGLMDKSGRIVQAMSVGKNRYGDGVEIYRLASLPGMRVLGGVSRLLSAVERRFPDETIITYADLRWGSGAAYKEVGFTRQEDTRPGYFWAKGLSRYSRVSMQKHKLSKILANFDDTLSEADNCRANGYWKIFDCGHTKWKLGRG